MKGRRVPATRLAKRAVAIAIGACFVGCSAIVSFDGLTSSTGAGNTSDAASADGKSPPGDASNSSDGGATTPPAIVVFGGDDGNEYTSNVYVATPFADGGLSAWTPTASLPTQSFRGNAVTIGSAIYVMPGSSTASTYADQFELTFFVGGNTTTYTGLTAFPNPRYRAGAASSGSTLIIAGGWSANNPAMSDVRWARTNDAGQVDSWNFGPDLPSQKSGPCLASFGSFVFSAGGGLVNEAGTDLTSNNVYMASVAADGSLSTWTSQAALIVPTQSCAAVAVNGYLYVVAGYVASKPGIVQFAKINSNGVLGTFNSTAALELPRAIFGLVAVGDVLYAIGGDDGNPLASVESARIASDGTIEAWSQTTPLPAALSGLSAVSFGSF